MSGHNQIISINQLMQEALKAAMEPLPTTGQIDRIVKV